MSDQPPNTDLTRLERLAALLRQVHVDPETLDSEGLDRFLAEHKIEMTGPRKRFDALLKKAKAEQRLERARAQRLAAVQQAHARLSSGSSALDAVRTKVRGMIDLLRQRDPDQALVYARQFEKATPEDLKTLEDDLTLLEMDEKEHDQGDPKNPR